MSLEKYDEKFITLHALGCYLQFLGFSEYGVIVLILARREGTRQDRQGDDRAAGEALPRQLRQRGGYPHARGRHRVRRTAQRGAQRYLFMIGELA